MIIAETIIPTHPTLVQMIGFCISGFLLVMIVLCCQSVLTSLVGKCFMAFQKAKK